MNEVELKRRFLKSKASPHLILPPARSNKTFITKIIPSKFSSRSGRVIAKSDFALQLSDPHA